MDATVFDIPDIRERISYWLTDNKRSETWLASEINSSQSHIHRILKLERPLTPENLERIEKATGQKFSS